MARSFSRFSKLVPKWPSRPYFGQSQAKSVSDLLPHYRARAPCPQGSRLVVATPNSSLSSRLQAETTGGFLKSLVPASI